VAGQQVVERHAGGVEIVARAWCFSGKGLGGKEAGRTRQLVRQVAGQARTEGQAEIHYPQFAILAQVQVLRFDVAVQDIAPVQHAHGADQSRRQLQPVGERHRALGLEPLRQRRSGIFALYVIEMLALRQRVDFGEAASGDPTQKPFLLQQGGRGLVFVLAARR